MRALLASAVAALTAAGLVGIRPVVVTSDEARAAGRITELGLRQAARVLSDEAREGTGPTGPDDRATREYVAARFAALGLEPGAPDGSWFQPVELVSVRSRCPPEIRASHGTDGLTLRLREDYVALSAAQRPEARLDEAEVVFVGYGIVAPEYGWDDYKGADLRGKTLLFVDGEPGSDPGLFEGKRRLHYGRPEYKFERAASLGAAGAIVIHTEASTGYAWQVVQSSAAGEQLAAPFEGRPALEVKGWLTEDASRRVARLGGFDLDALRAAAETRVFRPVPLGVRLSLTLENVVTLHQSANVIGRWPGSDAALGRDAVLYTAHHDQPDPAGSGASSLRAGAPAASGLAAMLAIAEAFTALAERPRRSILFADLAAGEHGLLGSEELARHPPLPTGRIAAAIDVGGLSARGRTRDVAVVGLGKSSLDEWIRAIAEAQQRTVVPEAFPERGAYYRSDHFNLARAGVPSACIEPGRDLRSRRDAGVGWPLAVLRPGDADLSGAVEDAQLLFQLGLKVAQTPVRPAWRPGDEFEPARLAALGEIGAR